MTKSTITRERLEALANAEYCKSNPGAWLLGLREVNELARMALAAMDSDPDYKERKLLCSTDTARMRKVISVSAGTEDKTLYHAQPVPVVPEEITAEQAYEIGDYHGDPVDVFARGANWMRQYIIDSTLAAATQSPGSEPATVPGKWIPVSERMPEEVGRYWCYVEEQNSLGKSHYQWNCSWNGDAWSDKALTGRVTHWMPLPAAPQEVKGE